MVQQVLGVSSQALSTRLVALTRLPLIPMVILVAVLFVTLFAPFLTPYSPGEIALPNKLQAPIWQEGGSPEHFLGTDTLGRDLLTRIYFGGRVSLVVVFYCLLLGGGVGLILGITAGYLGGRVDAVIMRLVDSLMSLPSILLALVFAMTLGPSMRTVILAITVVLWTRIARVVRGETLKVVKQDYILQAKVAGCSTLRIMLVHIVPNVFNIFMVLLSLDVGQVILLEASLSFLGAGIPPPTPSWGQMVSEGRGYITSAWWISFFPGLALALTVLAFNMFGDWLRDRLDPRLRQL